MKKYVSEFIGTFFLVLTVWLALKFAWTMAPIAIGSVLMVMIYAWAHISWAHFNPAVTLALYSTGSIPLKEMLKYRSSQLLAAVCASITVIILWVAWTAELLSASMLQIIVAEFLFTFALVRVVLNVATTQASHSMSYYGLAIWFTVVAGAYAVWSISGAVFNPAVLLGNVVDGLLLPQQIWMHAVGQLLWSLCAAWLFKTFKIQ